MFVLSGRYVLYGLCTFFVVSFAWWFHLSDDVYSLLFSSDFLLFGACVVCLPKYSMKRPNRFFFYFIFLFLENQVYCDCNSILLEWTKVFTWWKVFCFQIWSDKIKNCVRVSLEDVLYETLWSLYDYDLDIVELCIIPNLCSILCIERFSSIPHNRQMCFFMFDSLFLLRILYIVNHRCLTQFTNRYLQSFPVLCFWDLRLLSLRLEICLWGILFVLINRIYSHVFELLWAIRK